MAKEKKVKEEKQISSVDNVFAQLIGQHNRISPNIATSGVNMESEVTHFIDTGYLLLNMSLSNRPDGGWPCKRIVEVFGKESIGKAQPHSAKILTPEGWSTMGDMEVGSIITAADGTETTVIDVFPQGEQDVYEITFTTTCEECYIDIVSYTECTLEHLWKVYTIENTNGEVLSLEEIRCYR